ncbi:MAG: glycosyltransferase family 2 protein [Candidatus Pacebacteria bacterium]|nr:glycosyltransferase family 2 protein [Candidatus Paceibacterota bacterium]
MDKKSKIEKIFLSICIPTKNQPRALQSTLDSILPQIKDFGVEIVVCDDSDKEESKSVIDSYNHKSIRYFKGKKGGFDEAIIFLTKEARGDYLIWFGDDLMEEGMIKKIKELVYANADISFIWVNSCDKLNPKITAFKDNNDKFFNDRNEIIKKDIGLLAFMSSTIIKKENISDIICEAHKYSGLSLMSLFFVLGAISVGGRYYFIGHPYIISDSKPSGEARWYDSFQVHAINFYMVVKRFKGKFDKSAIKKSLSDKFARAWRAVIVERAMGLTTGFGSKSPKVFKMAKFYWTYPEFYIALPLFLTPRPILNFFYKYYRFLFRRREKIYSL